MNLNDAFKFTYKLLLGGVDVELDDVKDWLLENHYPVLYRNSETGERVAFSSPYYSQTAKVANMSSAIAKSAKLNINQIKDIDSIVSGLGEIAVYTGNKTFGRCEGIEDCDSCVDSFFVKGSHNVQGSKYVAYSSYIRDGGEFIFGSALFPGGKHLIKVIEAANLTRCFETYTSATSSDLYCSYYCFNCADLMFSFNLKSKRNCIGNLELPKEKYQYIKQKLLLEIREYIKKNKRFYPPFILPGKEFEPLNLTPVKTPSPNEYVAASIADKSFRETCKVIFGKEIGSAPKYEQWLTSKGSKVQTVKTAFGNEVCTSDVAYYPKLPKDRIINAAETLEASKLAVAIGADEELTLEKLTEKVKDIALYPANVDEGQNLNNAEVHVAYNVANSYKVCDGAHAKNCAYSTMVMASEWVFGCIRALHSKFSINCYNSNNMTGCFEMDSCNNCSSSMFCHNCENLDNCMFCFNAKSLRYAIANVEVGRERYMQIKQMVLNELTKKLEANGKLDFDIFNLVPKT